MGELISLSVYNPASLSDDDFLRSFVARQMVAKRLIERLKEVKRSGLATHHLLLGQRGMGKTSMLRRLALAVTSDELLSRVFIPLTFREEQYNVHSLDVFWTNCLDALADWFEKTGQADKAQLLDLELIRLHNTASKISTAAEIFKKWISQEDRRPLLLLDNIDLIFNGLKAEQWALRKHLQEPGGVVVVGGSATLMEATADRDAAFYDFFQITKLDKLTKDELIACLRSLALARGAEGEKVTRLVDQDPARIKTLHDLTGGNPRTLTLLYILLEMDAKGDVFSDLERLLDQVTVLYKARVEDLPPQARVVLDAVALAWNPVLASDVAQATALEVTTVSSQLDRLQKEGVVEKVSVSKTTKSAYQVAERFFNIWYLMRHGPRRQRTRLRWLTGFLRSFYSAAQLVERAKRLVTETSSVGEDLGQMVLALSEAIEDEGWRSLLKNHIRDQLERYAESIGKRLEDIVDPSEVPRPVTAAEWVRHGNLLRQHLKRFKEAEAAFLTAVAVDATNWAGWFNLGNVRVAELADASGGAQALRHAVFLKPNDIPSHFALANALQVDQNLLEAEVQYRKCLELDSKFYLAALALGDLVMRQPQRLPEAEAYYELAGKLAPQKDTTALDSAAYFAAYIAEEFDRAIAMYERLLTIKPNDFVAQSNLYVLRHFGSKKIAVKFDEQAMLRRHPAYARSLIQALVLLSRGGASEIVATHFPSIFETTEDELFENYRGFVLLLFRESERKGIGSEILKWLEDSEAGDRHWPLFVAYDSFIYGAERLMDVNPEVRGAANEIVSLLEAPSRYSKGIALGLR